MLSALGPPYIDRTLPAQVVNGINTISWDGLDGNGLPVPNGSNFQFFISYVNGLTHLPLYDVEFNENGFRLYLIRPMSVPAPPDPLFYWDDSNLPGGTTNFTGCLSTPTTGCHIWNTGGGGFGNNRTINTWWYAVSTSTANVIITEKRAPGNMGPIAGQQNICPGSTNVPYSVPLEPNSTSYQWSYSGTGATIINNGSNSVTINFAVTATTGVLTVQGSNNECGLGGTPSTITITMQPFPPVVLAPYTPVCTNTPAFALSGGTPVGGTYYIGGVPATTFDPAAQGVGTFTISYFYSDPVTGCSKTVDQPLIVASFPVVGFQPLASVCSYNTPFPLSGGSPAGGVYSGPGVSGGIFDPSAAGPGTHTITYTYTDTCVGSATQNITVFAPPNVILAPLSDVCINLPPFLLNAGSPPGGEYSGPGVTPVGMFDPLLAGTGTHTITYTYADLNGCFSSDNKPITVDPLPGPAGSISGTTALCQGTTALYSVPVITNAISYNWTILPASAGTIAGTTNSVSITWDAAFSGNATLTVAGMNPCGQGNSSSPYNITVNPKPVVTFSYCVDSITTTNARPITLKGGLPIGGTYAGPGVSAGTFNPTIAGTGNHTIQYAYTNNWGCNAAANKVIKVVAAPLFNCGMNFTDIRDNKSYATVLIGSQCWMSENLNYGSTIGSVNNQRDNCIPEKYCYGNIAANCTASGGLYEWDEIMGYSETAGIKGLCPPAWHLPTNAEWTILFNNYINNGFAGNALKFSGFSGFNALLTGTEHSNTTFDYGGFASFHWTSTRHSLYKAWAHGMNTYDPSVSLYPSNRNHAFSVRCIKD